MFSSVKYEKKFTTFGQCVTARCICRVLIVLNHDFFLCSMMIIDENDGQPLTYIWFLVSVSVFLQIFSNTSFNCTQN